MSSPLVAVEIDLYDGSAVRTLRASNRTLTAVRDGVPVQFEPRLYMPIQLGASIAAEQYGQPVRGAPNGGTIDLALDEGLWPWLAFHWQGQTFRVYAGEAGDAFDDLALAYVGRVADLTFDAVTNKLSVKTTDAALDLDGPLVPDLYPDDALPALRGRPKPYLRGTVYSAQPVLEDEPTRSYRLSGTSLAEILELRVGGVPWQEAAGAPAAGQWAADLVAGTFRLGSSSAGNEVRCDARAVGWDSLTSAALLAEIVGDADGTIDAGSLAAFAAAAPGLIGLYKIDPVNRLDVLDEITVGAGGWWGVGDDGAIRAGVLAAPDDTADAALGERDIATMELAGVVPQAWRLRVEYRRNWMPLTNPLQFVTDADATAMAAGGIVAAPYENAAAKTAEPRAVDVGLIRSLFVEEADALATRDRLAAAWGVPRRLYDVTSWAETPALYATASVDFQMIQGNFRVHSAVRSIGGAAPAALRLWG